MSEERGTKLNTESEVDKMIKAFGAVLERQYERQNGITRQGDRIILPEGISYTDAVKAIQKHEKGLYAPAARNFKLDGHPHECLVAFTRAMKREFGNVLGASKEVNSFFGSYTIPGLSKAVPISFDENMNVPYGTVEIPGLPVSFEVEVYQQERIMDSYVIINAQYEKRFEPLIDKIEAAVREEMRDNPIFKGKAINSDFQFINLGAFDLSRIVHGVQEERDLNAHIFRTIKSTKDAQRNGLNVKRTVLLYGPYGTGKTLTALEAANVSVENGWTFINVKPGDDIVQALEFAKRYQPCCVFFEDIDRDVSSGDRTDKINTILNSIDGVLSKNTKILSILTTNNADKIQPAMLRPGRIDAVIKLGVIDEQSLERLVARHTNGKMGEAIDSARLLKSTEGYTPSFIVEACGRAILYAVDRVDGDFGSVKITNNDLEASLQGLREQYRLMTNSQEVSPDRGVDGAITKVVRGQLEDAFMTFKSNHLDKRVVKGNGEALFTE